MLALGRRDYRAQKLPAGRLERALVFILVQQPDGDLGVGLGHLRFANDHSSIPFQVDVSVAISQNDTHMPADELRDAVTGQLIGSARCPVNPSDHPLRITNNHGIPSRWRVGSSTGIEDCRIGAFAEFTREFVSSPACASWLGKGSLEDTYSASHYYTRSFGLRYPLVMRSR